MFKVAASTTSGLYNSLATKPQMGWNSWNNFGCEISADLIKNTTDQFIALNLSSHGYKYINVDDCWQSTNRDAEGHIVPDATRFPNGMKDLADYVHGKNLSFGLYSSAGTHTC